MIRLLQIIFTICFLSVPITTLAQTEDTEKTEDSEQPSSTEILELPPAYERQMLRLSEILGSLHYIRELCGANEGQKWRDEMQNMIDKEEPSEEARAQMIAHFNNGFRGFQETYRECTTSAIEANNRYIAEGTKLSGEIPTRFGR